MSVPAGSALAQHIAAVPLVDHHVHGCWTVEPDRRRFENALNEANVDPIADFDSGFDTQLGFAVRAHCAPPLGLPPHANADEYWQRRATFTETELAQLFLRAAGVTDWLVDTGLSDGVADVETMAILSGARAREVIRLEQIAEQAIHDSADYADAFDARLTQRAAGAVATKSILAYRGGFEGDLSEPTDDEVADAAARWRDRGGRLTDRVLLRFGLHRGRALGIPLQLHVGLGDRECDLHKTNPLLLLDFLRTTGDTPIMLLHNYPYAREAGYLAQAFNNVYVDAGLSINHLGARAKSVIAHLLELAPFRKIVYSSDGYGPAELHHLGAALWRNGLRELLQAFVDAGEWSERDAMRVADLIGHGNAARVYHLEDR
ncbi:MAG TPA: amidohydrolase family protein [Mycobacterium sp.]|nr:amidohydrolase family protein [Mycobacterium sp.]